MRDQPRKDTHYTFSHDPKDAAYFTHKAFIVKSPKLARIKIFKDSSIVAIRDEEKKHYHFLKAWDHLEIDIHTQWSINNGVMGVEIELENNGRHTVHYMAKLSLKMVEKILRTPLNCMAICDESQNILLHIKPLRVDQLYDFFCIKKATDRYIKDKGVSHLGWILD